MSGVLTDIQTKVLGIMQDDEYYSPFDPLYEQIGDISNRIQRAVREIGLSIVVMTPEATVSSSDAPGPYLDPITVAVQISELVIVNRGDNGSKLPASDVAEHTMWKLHYPNHPTRDDTYHLIGKSIRLKNHRTLLVYQVLFETAVGLAGISE